MGRIVDLFGEVAAAADEGAEGLVLSPEADGLREDWHDEDIEDALQLVRESLLQGELVDSADSLSSRLVEVLGGFGEPGAFKEAEAGRGALSLDTIGHLVRRVAPAGGDPGRLPRRRASDRADSTAPAPPDGRRHRGRDGSRSRCRPAADAEEE